MTYQSINPNNRQLLKTFEHLSNAQLDTALAAAQATCSPTNCRH